MLNFMVNGKWLTLFLDHGKFISTEKAYRLFKKITHNLNAVSVRLSLKEGTRV